MDLDKDVIEASFAKQYGIRLSQEEIGMGEFLRLLSGLMPDTPLGHLVAIRSCANPNPSKEERRIKGDWARFCAGQSEISQLEDILAKNFLTT